MKHLPSILKDKNLLLDTCVLIHFHKLQQSAELLDFFQTATDANCALITIDQIYCEFLKYSQNIINYSDLLDWLKHVVPDSLFPSKEDLFASNQIYLAMKSKDFAAAERCSLEDLLLGAILMRWPNNVLLATTNHRDFPTWLYTREAVYAFDDLQGILQTIGIYRFDGEKYQKLIEKNFTR